ncbi:tRNA pseudouridine(55) synthase TruB [Nitratifractor salsuginis]|uniref:tRNA pseudouridine synthase B n=1 Tax=Nitratifractor salsuginis (strain DSM 16511 / JCM 12458 / E9I37-1) TaxID=749222 RepID=E6WZB3_NITSE|nr:tRNA pseudouridine(55) synthase TruB [Nitratifractor salsuginis]ADV46625.1 tRNA pseudouridine synthase B [Nitratifractor salsuginis DSM 16511]
MNRLFVVDKPIFISSNRYMNVIKRKYGAKKVGFSGTLDPFATGCLIVATGQYTRLFQYLKKTPKSYRATLWLGAESASLDIENITRIVETAKVDETKLWEILASLEGELKYLPPKYSAKKIGGERAYDVMRRGGDIELRKVRSEIYELKLLHYRHPFITFEATVSEGTYIRSLGEMIAEVLGVPGTLSSLRRLHEGKFQIGKEEALDPLEYLAPPKNRYFGDPQWLELGKKLQPRFFENQKEGLYVVETDDFFSILEFKEGEIKYRLNRMPKFMKESKE